MKIINILSTMLCVMLLAALPITAQNTDETKNKAIIETTDGNQELNTDDIQSIRFDGGKITVVQSWGETSFDRTLRSLSFQRPNPGTLRLTAATTIGSDNNQSNQRRAQAIDGDGKLKSTWESGDVVYVYADASTTTSIGTLTPTSYGESTATLSGDINADGLTNGQTLYFSTKDRATLDLSTQDGTVESLFYFTATGTLTIDGGNASISNLAFTRPIAVVKFTLIDKATGNPAINATRLIVNDGTNTYTVTPASAKNELFVGIPSISSKTITLTATNGNEYYLHQKTGVSFTNNLYYAINVKMRESDLARPLTFEAKTAGATVAFTKGANAPSVNNIEYSTDGGVTWAEYTYGTGIQLTSVGDKVSFRGTNARYATGDSDDKYSYFSCSDDCYIYGNVMSLINKDNYAINTSLTGHYAFCNLFHNNENIYNHPTKSLKLPATTLSQFCYLRLFNGCTKLTFAPDLPATTLAHGCYYHMFNGCTGLTSAPVLPATTLASFCYCCMFYNCTGLTSAPALPATTLASTCYSNMFYGCTGLTSAPALPATTLAEYCYDNMFNGCTNLTSAPVLPATTLANRCYYYMFKGCTNLNSVTCLATDISASYCTYYWLSGVAASGTFYKAASMNDWTTGASGIPSGWTTKNHVEGALKGKFTINGSGGKVYFSQGNLQYLCSTSAPEWKFAEHQYDYIAYDNSAYSENSGKWIDLFAYGTSGYNNGQTNYQPWKICASGTWYSSNLTGNADWGYNAISNGGNTENIGWRTLTHTEWQYLFQSRTDAASKYGYGSIGGVNGVILLPDSWTLPDGLSFTAGTSAWTNSYTTEQWALMEAKGAVFLPASGSCNNLGIPSESTANQNGFYRSSTNAYYVHFKSNTLDYGSYPQYGDAVRLVRNTVLPGTISYATTAVNKLSVDAVFTNELTKVGDGTVSYSKSGDDICTVNATTGEVTLNGNVGSCTITATVSNGFYTYATNTASYTLTVKKNIAPTLSLTGWTYGDAANTTPTLEGNEGNGAVTYQYKLTSADDNTYTTFDATHYPTAAGDYTLKVTIAANGYYNAGEKTAAFSIARKSLTVTAEAKSRGYGAENPTLTYTHGDLATGDTESVFTGALECEATTASELGEYDITQGTLSAGDNYEIAYTGAKLTVNPLDMSSGVTVTPYSASYDGNAHGITIALSGAAEGATITYCDTENGTYQAENYTNTDVAAARTVWYKIVKEHYTTIIGNSTVTILAAAASVTAPTAVDGTLTYNGSAQTLFNAGSSSDGTLMYKVTTTSDQPTSTEGFSAFDESISQRTNAGTYYLWYYVDGDANHNDTEINTTGISMSIGKKSLTVTANAQSRNYGAENPILTYTHGDLATGDDESVFTGALECEATTASELGEYDITQGTLSAGDNYEIAYTGAKLTVNPLDMSSGVTVTPYSASYDGNAHGITIALSGAAEGATITYCDTENGTYQAENYTYTDVAEARIVWYKIVKEHYTTITGSSTVTITQASNSFTTQPTITGWTYGQSANAPTGGVVEFGDIVYKYCATADGTYDTYANVVNGQAGTWYVKGFVDETTNYAAAESDAVSFTISAAAASVTAPTAVDGTLTYNGSAQTLFNAGSSSDGTLKYKVTTTSDQPTSTEGFSAFDESNSQRTNAGTYYLWYYVDGDANHNDTEINTTGISMSIGQKPLTITAKAQTVNYGIAITLGTNQVTTGSLCSGHSLTGITLTQSTTDVTTNGTITPSAATIEDNLNNDVTSNYNITYSTGVLTVLPVLDLSSVTANTTVPDGVTITGELGSNVKISIADGATVTLSGVTINRSSDNAPWAGITCDGDATINLSGENYVMGMKNDYAGLFVPEGSTLIIQGDGLLHAVGRMYAAGIGGSNGLSCGNILIKSGTITAESSYDGAGIGTGGAWSGTSSCGTITISGGTVTATGGNYGAGIGSAYNNGTNKQCHCAGISITGGTVTANGGNKAAGIGSGYGSTCGDVTISSGVTSVTATKGTDCPRSIGAGVNYTGGQPVSTCGTVTIGGNVGAITTSPYTFPVGAFTINSSGDRVYFAPGNMQYKASTSTWRFAEHQWDYVGDANASISSSYTGWIDLFGWGTSGISGYTPIATCYQPYSTSTTNADYNPYGSSYNDLCDGGDNAGKADWGYAANAANLGGHNTWRTLKDKGDTSEWEYIFDSRTTGVTVNGTSNARYTVATINTDGTGVNGIILFPDNYTGPTSSTDGITFSTINDKSSWGTKCTSAGWAVLEGAGCVFLPAAGQREGTVPSYCGIKGHYWSSSYSPYNSAYSVYFSNDNVTPKLSENRKYGFSVRLVRPVE